MSSTVELYFTDNSCVLFHDDISTADMYKMLRKHPKAGDGLVQDTAGVLVLEEEGRSLTKNYTRPFFFVPSMAAAPSTAEGKSARHLFGFQHCNRLRSSGEQKNSSLRY